MSTSELRFGLVGVVPADDRWPIGRAVTFAEYIDEIDGTTVHAVCDIDESGLEAAREGTDAAESYLNYEEMLEESDIDAVLIGTPMPLHAEQSIAALEREIHVLCEVPAGVSVEECKELVRVAERSDAKYMMAENYNYKQDNLVIRELVREGLFGEVYFAEGEYVHDLKELLEITEWRRKWQAGIDGITYPSHQLGPILDWMPGDRVTRVSCEGSGHHYTDPRGDTYEQEDTTMMLAKTEQDRLIKVRLDLLSNRPGTSYHQLQGTKGCYEVPRTGGEGQVWLADHEGSDDSWEFEYDWTDIFELYDEYLPERWQNASVDLEETWHGGGDYLELVEFVDAIRNDRTPEIDVHQSMDMTLPGLISQESVERDGEWLKVPDSRDW